MTTTSITTMRENLTKLDAKEIHYYKWTSSEPYTVIATDGEKYGQAITIGYVDNLELINQLGLPCYHNYPFN